MIMTFDEAKQLLRDRYATAGLKVVDEHPKEVFFQSNYGRGPIHLSEEDIAQYLEFEGRRAQYRAEPVECSMVSPTYREHSIRPSDFERRFLPVTRDISFTFGDPAGAEPYAQISQASQDFINFMRLQEAYLPLSVARLQRPIGRRDEKVVMKDMLYRPLTIKVMQMNAASLDEAKKTSDAIIDAALFGIACLKDMAFDLHSEWPRRHQRIEPFRFEESPEGSDLPLPRARYTPDLVRFYLRGCSASDPVVQFLSFYQVLEYFFLTSADEQLYARLATRLHDPHFAATPKHLDKLIQDTLEHKRETDETEMLKLVLQKYTSEPDVIQFISSYEAHLKDTPYTKKRSVFGEENQVNLQPGHVFGGLSRRIKLVRNALIHSSDRHERKDRYVPTRANESIIEREVPLVEFLAEKVVIASAQST
jgi:hypothetical protein